jgi:hypothetical protein
MPPEKQEILKITPFFLMPLRNKSGQKHLFALSAVPQKQG